MSVDAKQILKRFERMKSDHQLWESGWQEIADYIVPRRSQFITKKTPGAKQTQLLFDSTAPDALGRLASTLNSTLTSRAIEWFSLLMSDDALNENNDVKIWLEDCGKRMHRSLNQSNFYQEIYEVYSDETAFGTSGLFVEEHSPEKKEFTGFVFRALPLNNLYIDEDFEGRVNTVYRWFQMSAAAALAQWGRDNLGIKVLKAVDDGKSDTLFTFLHCVYPRNQEEPKLGVPKTDMPWACVYLCIEDVKESDDYIDESGYQEFPIMVPRWSKSPGEKYGRGPGHTAIPDVKTLNKIKEITLKMMAKALDPPVITDDSLDSGVNSRPGGITKTTNIDRGVKTLFPPGTFREALGNEQIKSNELIAAIKRIFYSDLMELPNGPQMTATEVVKRIELLERNLGPVIGRQETELHNPLIDRLFGIMFRKNAFLPTPQVLLQLGANIDVQYEGPLARSQRLTEIDGLERLQGIIVGIAQLDPSVVDNIDYDKAVLLAGEILGVSAKLLRDPDQVKRMRDARAKQQQQEKQLAAVSTIAEAAGKAAPALKLLPGATSTEPYPSALRPSGSPS